MSTPTVTAKDETPVAKKETLEERKARFARVLDRGHIQDRLHVPLPPELHGEWVSKDPREIMEKEALGFRVDKEYAKKSTLHAAGADGSVVVGDTIFMVCAKEDIDLVNQIKAERYAKANSKNNQKEDTGYKHQMTEELSDLPVISESTVNNVRKEELEAAIEDQAKVARN